jgi:plastocyanin
MNKAISATGLILIFVAAFFFLADFGGGKIGGIIIAPNPFTSFAAFLFTIIFLPIGSGLAFVGLAYRRPILAAGGMGGGSTGSLSSGLGKAILVVAIVAVLVGAVSLAAMVSVEGSVSSLTPKTVTSVEAVTSTLTEAGAGIGLNQTPTVIGYKIQWCLQDVMQDRFCPDTFTVVQGDIVQVLFIQNDTADHTFTLGTGTTTSASDPYNFQINDSGAGQLDFLNNYLPVTGSCSNTGSFSQITAGISGTYCVSGTSLLSNATLNANNAYDFAIAQNPSPGLPFTNGNQTVGGEPPGVTLTNTCCSFIPVNDSSEMLALNITPINASLPSAGVNLGGSSESQGIGAFQATTPGVYEFYCHYHVSNGMFGYLIVLPNAYCTGDPSACGLTS